MRSFSRIFFAGLGSLALGASVFAAAPGEAGPLLSPHVASQFDVFRDLVEKKDFAALLIRLDALLPATDPESYDRALLSQIRSQVLLGFAPPRYAEAIPSLETAILLGDTHGYFDAGTTLDALGTLSQLYYEFSATTRDLSLRRSRLRQAYDRIARWIDASKPDGKDRNAASGDSAQAISVAQTAGAPVRPAHPEGIPEENGGHSHAGTSRGKDAGNAGGRRFRSPPRRAPAALLAQTATAHLYAATLLYTDATLDASLPADAPTLQRALVHARESLVLRPGPDDPTLVLLLAISQLLERHAEAAEILEQLVRRSPDNPAYWQQLAALYATLATRPEQPASVVRSSRARALLAFRRAEAAGHRLDARERYNRVAILTAMRQYAGAIGELEASLALGGIDNTRENWELLAALLQQQRQTPRAIAVLEEAVRRHLPGDPDLLHALARAHLAEGHPEKAIVFLEKAVRGKLGKPAEAWMLLAYLGHELGRHAEALRWLESARRQPGARAAELDRLESAIHASRLMAPAGARRGGESPARAGHAEKR
ncbi:MAG: tetratricopeptide repeat protein [Puniceicoccales bacterium]|jgi:tetratricopeptide (TPR) repeat protein|nr:tetratricopeptide repeat protein [Puniceicoccales bacterium]